MEYKKTNINNFVLHTIKNNNFKSIKIMINFRRTLLKKEATLNAFLFSLLTYRTKNYDYKSLIEKKEDLYSLGLSSNISYENDLYRKNSIHIKFLHPKYTDINQEKMCLELIKEVLFNPIFDDEKTNNKIKELIKTKILSEKEEKRIYSRNIMSKLLNNKYPNKNGYIKDLDNITPRMLKDYYTDIITNDQVDIFVVGDIDPNFYIEAFKDLFTTNNRYKKKIYDKYKNIEAKEYFEKEEGLSQAKLLVALKPINYNLDKEFQIGRVYGAILGSGPASKLFRVIREKNSLAYYTSIYREDAQIAVLESGIDINNYHKTLELIKECLKDMSNINLEDLNTAKNMLITNLESIEYYQNDIINFYFDNLINENNKSIDDVIKEIKEVSLDDIKEFNKKVHIDTILLYGDNNE